MNHRENLNSMKDLEKRRYITGLPRAFPPSRGLPACGRIAMDHERVIADGRIDRTTALEIMLFHGQVSEKISAGGKVLLGRLAITSRHGAKDFSNSVRMGFIDGYNKPLVSFVTRWRSKNLTFETAAILTKQEFRAIAFHNVEDTFGRLGRPRAESWLARRTECGEEKFGQFKAVSAI